MINSTALHLAVHNQNVEFVKLLLSMPNIDLNVKEKVISIFIFFK